MHIDPRLTRLLGDPELFALRQRLRKRYERLGPDESPTTLRLTELAPPELACLRQLAGLPSGSGRAVTLHLASLDARLHEAGIADSLRDALEQLDGPITAKAHLRLHHEAQWAHVLKLRPRDQRLQAWLDNASNATSMLKRLGKRPEQALHLLNDADSVLQHLPAKGIPRSKLAADVLGNAHALDAGKPVTTVVLATLRYAARHLVNDAITGNVRAPDTLPDDDDTADTRVLAAERQRDTWARAGILVNELARPALALNLPFNRKDSPFWPPGEPAYLSLRHLLRNPPAWTVAGESVFVCENPNVLAIAADALGTTCAPLVCTDGMPAAAQRTLLNQLHQAGARLHYHGDFDWPGVSIANFVIRTWNATPWQMDANAYESAARDAVAGKDRLAGQATPACWDEHLAPAMLKHGIAVPEEAVVEKLLANLQLP